MRQLLVLSLLLLGGSWAVAQNSPSSSQTGSTSASAGTHTVEGCLSGSDGKYLLTDMHGKTYELTGDNSKLAEHVGHEIKVTGTETTGSASQTAAGAAAGETGTTIEVSSVKHISKTCKGAGEGMAH